MIDTVNVIDPVIVAALGDRNETVEVIDTVDARGAISFANVATMRSSQQMPAA